MYEPYLSTPGLFSTISLPQAINDVSIFSLGAGRFCVMAKIKYGTQSGKSINGSMAQQCYSGETLGPNWHTNTLHEEKEVTKNGITFNCFDISNKDGDRLESCICNQDLCNSFDNWPSTSWVF